MSNKKKEKEKDKDIKYDLYKAVKQTFSPKTQSKVEFDESGLLSQQFHQVVSAALQDIDTSLYPDILNQDYEVVAAQSCQREKTSSPAPTVPHHSAFVDNNIPAQLQSAMNNAEDQLITPVEMASGTNVPPIIQFYKGHTR